MSWFRPRSALWWTYCLICLAGSIGLVLQLLPAARLTWSAILVGLPFMVVTLLVVAAFLFWLDLYRDHVRIRVVLAMGFVWGAAAGPGIAIFGNGVWHETTLAGLERKEYAEYLFGEIDAPRLDDEHELSPFDATRRQQLNRENPLVRRLISFIGRCLDEVRGELTLEQRFIELAGGLSDVEGLEWLHTFSD